MNSQLSSAHRLVFLTLGLGVSAVASAYFFSGTAALVVAGTLCVLLWLLRPLLMPPGYGAMKVRMLSVLGLFALAASYGFWSQLIDTATKALAASPRVLEVAPWLANVNFGNGPSVAILIFVAAGLWIVNHYMADRSIAGGHPVPIQTDFPELTFQRKLDSFCSALRQHLIMTDREANWSPDYYADLEAEVEIVALTGVAEKRRIVDLQGAMRSDRATRAFLVLGDPGAGKSVALRKLARDMLDQVGTTGRVPIYINLREWLPKEGRRNADWTEDKKPTIQELESFVIDNIKRQGDVFTEEFVDKYFRDLWKHGRLFFIFDSFDEIPELLDVNEESWLINSLSDVLSRFISSSPESRGVLASRIFRRPTQAFLAQKILDIRPMSEERIMQALGRFPAFTQELQVSMFRDRSDLVPIARNPFLMALLGEWVKDNHALPKSQAKLYENYLNSRLNKCMSKIEKANLTLTDVLHGATEIAWFVFNSPAYGLEAPVRVIDEELATRNAIAVIDVLSYARIARVTQSDSKSFAFVHRRFLEYLVTTRLLDQPDDLPIEHIPTDSRGRDALVLYAQLCDDGAAAQLAALCWSEIKLHFDDQRTHLRAIHSLRFLTDAFRSRRTAVAPFAHELAEFIGLRVENGNNLIQAKICLEGTGLLSETQSLPILSMSMEGSNSWLRETAFRACRHLPRLEPQLQESIASYVVTMPIRQFWNSRRELTLSLSLSESLRDVYRTAVLRYRNLLISAGAAPMAIAAAPALTVAAFFYALLFQVLIFGIDTRRAASRREPPHFPAAILFNREPFHLPSPFGFRYGLVEGFRMVLGAILVLSTVALLGMTFLDRFDGAAIRERLFLGLYPVPVEFKYLLQLLLGVCILDWLHVRATWRRLLPYLNTVRGLVIWGGLPILCVVALFYMIDQIFVWLDGKLPHWVPLVFGSIAAITIVPMLLNAGRGAWHYIRDRNTFYRIALTDRMSRQEIVATLKSLLTDHWRLAFVHQLAQRKIVANEKWPDGFILAVTSDPALTELAKLEERWMKLDR